MTCPDLHFFKPTQSPTTSEPTKSPSHSPTLSAGPSSSLCRDQFGVEKVYSSGEYSTNDWFAQWDGDNRTLSGYEEPVVDELDGRTSVSRRGAVYINGGIATLQRSPMIKVFAGTEGFGDHMEMTGYAKYLAGELLHSFVDFVTEILSLTFFFIRWSCKRKCWNQFGNSNSSSKQ